MSGGAQRCGRPAGASPGAGIRGGRIGSRIWLFQLDATIAVTPELTEIEADDGDDSVEVPERVGASVMLSLNLPLE